MSDSPKKPPSQLPPAKRDAAHEARLAAELRANLGRRKALSRARTTGASETTESEGPSDFGASSPPAETTNKAE